MAHDSKVNQKSASAGGNIVGRDHVEVHQNYRQNKFDTLVAQIKREQSNGETFDGMIEALQYFLNPVSDDGVIGLESKLKRAGREDQLRKALREKEEFAKIIDRWSHFASAQELLAYLLAAVEQRFNHLIYPSVTELTRAEFDAKVHNEVITPVMSEIGDEPLGINATVICGMIYWLAEQCFVRWHS